MSDPIEEMKKAGWESVDKLTYRDLNEKEYLMFTRPKQKPNAIVDIKLLEEIYIGLRSGMDYFLLSNMLEKAIKNVE